VTPAAFTTFLTPSSVIFCFNLCSSNAAYTYSMVYRIHQTPYLNLTPITSGQ